MPELGPRDRRLKRACYLMAAASALMAVALTIFGPSGAVALPVPLVALGYLLRELFRRQRS